MNLAFDGGTQDQHDLVNAAILLSTYDFDRIDSHVTVSFVADPTPEMTNENAFTTWTTEISDPCGQPLKVDIRILNTLARDQGRTFYQETVVHELGHVHQGLLDSDAVAALCDMFGQPVSHWNDQDLPWEKRVQEAQAETFKDVFLPSRRFDNRTRLRLPKARFADWLEVVSSVCPCGTS